MPRILVIPLLAGLLAMGATAQAGERHHERHGHHGNSILKHERHVARHVWQHLERAGHHGERHAWRAWRRSHHPVERHHDRYFPPHRPHGHRYRPHVRYRTHGHGAVDPLPVIGGGVLGGVMGNALGGGDPLATTTGLFIGSVVGYELGRH